MQKRKKTIPSCWYGLANLIRLAAFNLGAGQATDNSYKNCTFSYFRICFSRISASYSSLIVISLGNLPILQQRFRSAM
jgi:hypothetical protein